MSSKCSVCKVAFVDNEGDVCDNCMWSGNYGGGNPKPAGGNSQNNSNTYYNNSNSGGGASGNSSFRKVLGFNKSGNGGGQGGTDPTDGHMGNGNAAGSNNQNSNTSYLEGDVKNYKDDKIRYFFIERWFRTLLQGVPFTPGGDMQSFQLFDTWNGNDLNSNGQVCNQVTIYGKITHGQIHDGNRVRVYGKRNRRGVILADKVFNVTSGTTIDRRLSIKTTPAWIITITILAILAAGVFSVTRLFANHGSVGTAAAGVQTANTGNDYSILILIPILAIMLFAGFIFLKHNPKVVVVILLLIAAGLGIWIIPQLTVVILGILIILWGMVRMFFKKKR